MSKDSVYCSTCGKMVDVKNTDYLNIEEDFYGRDLMTFKCHECGTEQESNVYSKR